MEPEKGMLTETFLRQAQMLVIARTQLFGARGAVFGAIAGLVATGEITSMLASTAIFCGIGAAIGFASATSHKADIIEAALKQQTHPAPQTGEGPKPSA